jgi:outer membrane receptor protein involved in Fe transport
MAIMAVAAPAFAQDEGTTVGELIVTAQKREEAIQDVPIAVSAFSQDSLEKQKIDGGPNLVLAIPNVNFSKGNFTGYNFQIRGIGSKLVAGSGDAGTGIHLNNAPLTANNLFESEFFDVERVEVLRGPQGTLYGRNATGGVVNLITAKPTDDFEALIKGDYGNYNSIKARGMINVPIGDTIAVRASGALLQRDGYGENLVTGNDIDNRDLWNTRVTVSFEPTDTFNTYFMWDHFEEDDKRSRIGKQFCTKDPGFGGFTYSANPDRAAATRGLLSQGCLSTPLDSPNVLGTPNSSATLGGLLGNLSGLIAGDAYAGKMQVKDIRDIESAADPIYQAKTDIYQFGASWDVTDELQIISLTNYSKNELFTQADYNRVTPINTFGALPSACNNFTAPCASGAPVPTAIYNAVYAGLFPGGVVNDPQVGASNKFTTFDISSAYVEQWSQELRLASNFDGPLNFNVGAIYLDLKSTDGHYYVFGNTLTGQALVANALVTGNPLCTGATPGCIVVDQASTPTGAGRNYFDSTGDYHLKSRAAFGEVYWQVVENFKITGGLRYTHDRKLVIGRTTALLASNVAAPGNDSTIATTPPVLEADFKEVTGRVGADWKPDVAFTDETLLYGFYSRGYKAGGVNPPCAVGVACAAPTFDPEFVDAIEFGAKNTLLDGRMVVNGTYFNYNYIGYQVSKITNRQSVNENIDAKIQGFELETLWEPVDRFRLNMSLGILESEITGGSSIDVFDRTQGDPNLILVKASNASNCVANKAGVAALVNVINLGAVSPYALLGVCSGAFASAANPLAGFGVISNPALLPGGGDGVAVNLKGKELPNAPKWTLTLGAQYTWELGGWDATLRGDYYRQDDSFSRIYNSKADAIEGWQNVNATFTVANRDAGLTFELYAKNLTDEESITDTYLTDDSSGLFRNAFYTEPRTFGVSVTKTFGQ